MSTTARHYYHRQLVHRAHKPAHVLTVRFLSVPRPAPRAEPSIEEQLHSARAIAEGYRRRTAMARRPVRAIQLAKFAETWEAKVRDLEEKLKARQAQGELFLPSHES